MINICFSSEVKMSGQVKLETQFEIPQYQSSQYEAPQYYYIQADGTDGTQQTEVRFD